MQAILFAFISYLGWGVGDVFGTIAARKLGAYSTAFWTYILRLVIFSLYVPFALKDLSSLTLDTFFVNILLGILLLVGFLTFNEGLRIANPALVGTIAGSFPAIVIVLSIVFLKEMVTTKQVIAILIIFLGILLSTLNLQEVTRKKLGANRGIFLAIVALFVWGVYFTFIKIPVREIGWFWPNYISFTLFPLIFLFMKIRQIKLHGPKFQGAFIPLFFTVLFTGVAEFSFNFGISKGLTSVVGPIAGSYPTLFAFLSFLVFKDPIKKQQIVGIITTLIGIVLLSVFSI